MGLRCRIYDLGWWQPLLGAVGSVSRIDLVVNGWPDFVMPQGFVARGDTNTVYGERYGKFEELVTGAVT